MKHLIPAAPREELLTAEQKAGRDLPNPTRYQQEHGVDAVFELYEAIRNRANDLIASEERSKEHNTSYHLLEMWLDNFEDLPNYEKAYDNFCARRADRAKPVKIEWTNAELAAAGLDRSKVQSIANRLKKLANEMRELGLQGYVGSGLQLTHQSRPHHTGAGATPDRRAVIAVICDDVFEGGDW